MTYQDCRPRPVDRLELIEAGLQDYLDGMELRGKDGEGIARLAFFWGVRFAVRLLDQFDPRQQEYVFDLLEGEIDAFEHAIRQSDAA